ncbi:MAG: ribonuclease HI family protein [Acidobacteriota bacterium]
MKEPIRVFIDGGSRGNPGPAGFGVHAEDSDGNVLAELYGYLGCTTNNVAEYAGLLAALQWMREQECSAFNLFSDSQLLVRQYHGKYRVRSQGLLPLYRRARTLASGIPALHVNHVRREQNRQADALANRAMDERNGNTPSPLLE